MRRHLGIIIALVVVAFGNEASAQSVSLGLLNVPGKRVFDPSLPGPGSYKWSYSAKFLCGTISLPTIGGLPDPLLAGTYLTAINIRNYNFKAVPITKRVVLTKPESQAPGLIGSATSLDLTALQGLEVDCKDIVTLLGGATPPDLTTVFIKGFVMIESVLDLDVVGVYTVKP